MRHLKLQTQMLLSVGFLIFVAFGISTAVHIRDLTQNYFAVLELRAEALAQNLVNEMIDMYTDVPYDPDMLLNLQGRCEQLYTYNNEKHITHIAVISSENIIKTHNDKGAIEQPLDAELQASLKREQQEQRRAQITVLIGTTYHTLVPVYGTVEDMYLGAVDIGFPKHIVDEKVRESILHSAVLFAGFLLLSFFTVSLLIHFQITTPVRRLITVSQQLAEGGLVKTIYTTGRGDEIAVLGTAFSRIARYVQHIAEVASSIASGILNKEVQVRSAHDVLGNAVREMLQYLKHVADVATKVAEGDLTALVQVRSQNDAFGQVIRTMTEGLRTLIIQIRNSADQIAETGVLISSLTEQDIGLAERVYSVTEHMMATMQDIGVSVEEVAHNMATLSSSVQETSDSVLMITGSVTHIATNASELTKRSHDTIGVMEGAMESLGSVVKSTDISEKLSQETIQDALDGQQAFEHVMSSMTLIQETINTAVGAITGFEQRSQAIDTILNTIRGIAEQTGLLALNASIIAAQAGEHGRGFAVVADEIKTLAQGVDTSTKDITEILHTLQKETHTVVETIHQGASSVQQGMERTHQAQENLQKIIASARRSSSVVSEIAEALRAVMITSRDVVAAMEEVNAMTDDFTLAANDQETSTEMINNAVTRINRMASSIQKATDKQLSGVRQMLDAANDVTTLINQNLDSSHQIARTTEVLASQADLLVRSVDRFKLGV